MLCQFRQMRTTYKIAIVPTENYRTTAKKSITFKITFLTLITFNGLLPFTVYRILPLHSAQHGS